MIKHCLLAFAIVLASTTISEAGGGNSKSNGSIKFTNKSKTQIALVVVDPSDALLEAEDPDDFVDLGGRILQPGQSTTFKNLKPGVHLTGCALVDPDTTTVDADDFNMANVTVKKGKTTKINL